MDINIEELRKVLKAMEDFQVTELQYENLHLKRAVEKALRVETQANPETSVQAEATDDRQEQKGETIPSPVVGVFYSAPGPEQAPFVEVGSVVEEGDVLCIIEAMKLMNEVTAPRAGTITDTLVSTGQKVEYGQDLFVIE